VATQGSSGYIKLPGATGTPLPELVAQTVKPDNRIVVAFDSVSDAEQSRGAVRAISGYGDVFTNLTRIRE